MGARDALDLVAARARPVSGAQTRLLPVPAPLAPLFPDGGLRRGTSLGVGPLTGGCSLALSLVGEVTGGGRWVAAVGWPELGLVAAAELGVDLRRLALVPDPGDQWAAVVAALIDGFDLLLLRPPGRVRAAEARRLAARSRERGTVLLLLDSPSWPEVPDLSLTVTGSEWEGLASGHGRLTARRLEVAAGGRRAAGRERRLGLWLPGSVAAVAGFERDGPVALPGPPETAAAG